MVTIPHPVVWAVRTASTLGTWKRRGLGHIFMDHLILAMKWGINCLSCPLPFRLRFREMYNNAQSQIKYLTMSKSITTTEDRVPGPLSLPSSLQPWHCCSQAVLICATSSWCYRAVWGCGLICQGWGDQDYRHQLCCSPGSASSVCSCVSTFGCTGVWNSLTSCWAKTPLLPCGCFTDDRLKGEAKGNVSLHHDADVLHHNPFLFFIEPRVFCLHVC